MRETDLDAVEDNVVLLSLVASINDRQLDRVVIVELRQVVVAAFININVGPRRLEVSRAGWLGWNISVGARSLDLVVDSRVKVTGVIVDTGQVCDRDAMRSSRKGELSV